MTILAGWIYLKKTLIGDSLDEYLTYQNVKYKMNSLKMTYYFISLIIPAVIVSYGMGLNTYAQFYSEKIVINSTWQLTERNYDYSDIVALRRINSFIAPNGKTIQKPYHEIEFKNDFVWSFLDELAEPVGGTQ